MRFDGIKTSYRSNATRVYNSLKLINRHALVLVPLLGLTFAIIAGWVTTDYGTQYLFRDNEPLELLAYFGLCEHTYLCILKSARFHTALYSTALMGMAWTLFVLIEHRDDDPDDCHPVGKLKPVLPGVALLGLVMVVAGLLNKGESESYAAVVILSGAGFLAGLIVVAAVTRLCLLLSQKISCHQVWTFMALSAGVATVVAVIPLVTPSKAIFIALAAAVMVYCAFEIAKAHYRFPLAALIGAVLVAGAVAHPFKYRFAGLDAYYQTWSSPAQKRAAQTAAMLIEPRQALEAWLARQETPRSGKRKLVVVATSGGAYRATFWTAIVLDRLVNHPCLPDFDRAVRLLTGASGGMVAAAYYAASRQEAQTALRTPAPSQSMEAMLKADLAAQRKKRFFLANSSTDSLTPVVQQLIGHDALFAFLPLPNPEDRGQVLENEWSTLKVTFRDLAAGEQEGWRPSLIISPYLVDSAQPLFISNLNLKGIVKPSFAMEFFQRFPAAHGRFKLATAVRMSATFPLISPAVRLPLPNRPRVVDAGYFDNFGIAAAAMFLRDEDVRNFILENDLEVVLIRILAFPETEILHPDNPLWFRFKQVLEHVASPLEGALAARETRGRFVNDLLLEDLKRAYGERFKEFRFINPARASYSWHIQGKELAEMERGMSRETNKEELGRLIAAWGVEPRPL